jgi:hypothetical protein
MTPACMALKQTALVIEYIKSPMTVDTVLEQCAGHLSCSGWDCSEGESKCSDSRLSLQVIKRVC